ncbi:MAG: class I SAM-dependent methyltransferase, partial [Candidatus Hermodarchaeota archaeon]
MSFEKIIDKLTKYTRKPEGPLGKIVGEKIGEIHEKLAKWGISKVDIKPEDNILEIGCGSGAFIKKIAKNIKSGKIVGIDYSEAMVELSTENNKKYIESGKVEIKLGNVTSLPFSENYFNLSIGIETINFWPDIFNSLREIYRVLKPDGVLLIINNTYKNRKFRKRNKKW